MIIDLSEIIRDVDLKITLDEDIEVENTSFMGEEFEFSKPLHINGQITNNTKSLELKAKVTGDMQVRCARCRKPMTVPVSFSISEVIMQGEGEDLDLDVLVIEGEEIDIYDVLLNNFLMNVDGKYLCHEDCKGLCPKCGKDLNLGECSCDNDYIDPRWEKLAEIMKNSSDTK